MTRDERWRWSGWLVGGWLMTHGALACVGAPPTLPTPSPLEPVTVVLGFNRDVDVLFVIDNTGSMAEEQTKLALGFPAFNDALERPGTVASYRIGITTTDNGNPWCGTTGPEAGNLRLTSCRSRPTEFTFNGATVIEAFDETCAAVCPEEWTNIEIQPTVISGQDGQSARPWIESVGGQTNLPEGLTTTQAFQCFGPQGIDGCSFEQHLESMWKTLRRSESENEDEYGFIRASAMLAIVHITDEVDCSYNTDWETIFLSEGDRLFWSDPMAASPTSAVCWHAGVKCDGGDCSPIDLDVDGNVVSEAAAGDDAVLRPVERYIDIVREIETRKRMINPGQEVLVALIGGVNSDGTVTYDTTAMDPEFQRDFGIGPGCQSGAGTAVPPVREKALAEEFAIGERRNLFSVCDADFSLALETIAEAIVDQIQPACISACVGDADPATTELEPACDVYYHEPEDGWDGSPPAADDRNEIPECDDLASSSAPLCYRFLTEDARSQVCVDAGWNAEVALERRDAAALPEEAVVAVECEIAVSDQAPCGDDA